MHLQARVQAELDNVLGPDGRPTMQDKPSLPYTEVARESLLSSTMTVQATLMEVQRMSNIAPTGLAHVVTR